MKITIFWRGQKIGEEESYEVKVPPQIEEVINELTSLLKALRNAVETKG